MDIIREDSMLQNGAEAFGNATGRVRERAGRIAHRTRHGMRRAGREVNSFVRQRPVETALLGASAACLVAALAFWFSRRD